MYENFYTIDGHFYKMKKCTLSGPASVLISFSIRVQAYFDLGRPISGTRRRANCFTPMDG